jgi:bile acid:Na+ symporter, BASS family
MHDVDQFKIVFNINQLATLNVAMAFLMFSVALDVRLADFRQVVQLPKAVGVGLLVQYLVFPLATLGIIAAFHPPTSVALGMVLVSVCPSGNITNFLVHLSRANVALSVTLNAIIVLMASLVTPIGFVFWSKYVANSEAMRRSFSIEWLDMVQIIFQLILLPLLVGMVLNSRFPQTVACIRPWVQRLSLVLFFAILVMALFANRHALTTFLIPIFGIVALHNALGLGLGYASGRLARLPERDSRTLAFESGVHNTALGLLLIFRFFDGLGGMALIAAWWGIWDLVTGVSLAAWWRRDADQVQMATPKF